MFCILWSSSPAKKPPFLRQLTFTQITPSPIQLIFPNFIKEIVSPLKYFFWGSLKSNHYFHNIWVLFSWRKFEIKYLLAPLNHLLILKINPVTLFRKLVPAFRQPPVTIKVVPRTKCEYENCSERQLCIVHWKKLTNGRTAGTEILMRLSEYSLEL